MGICIPIYCAIRQTHTTVWRVPQITGTSTFSTVYWDSGLHTCKLNSHILFSINIHSRCCCFNRKEDDYLSKTYLANEKRALKFPKSKIDTFGKHAFAAYGPLAWDCLPKEFRSCDQIGAFKRNLKTHLFVKFLNKSTLAILFWRIIVKRPRMYIIHTVCGAI